MPIYTVRIDGKTYDLRGDHPPTEEEARAAIGAQPRRPVSAEDFTPKGPEGSATERFVGGALRMVNPIAIASGAYQAVRHPVTTYNALVDQSAEQFGKAGEAFGQQRYSEALGHGAAGLLPGIGPAAANAGEKIGAGDIAGGVGEATGLLVPSAVAAAAKPVGRIAQVAGKKAYGATAKFPRTIIERNPGKDLYQIGVERNLALKPATMEQINQSVRELENSITGKIAQSEAPISVEGATAAARERLTGPGGPFRDLAPDRAVVDRTIAGLAKKHPDFTTPVSADAIRTQIQAGVPFDQIQSGGLRQASAAEAQGLKQRLYGRVRDASWGELSSPQQETLKSIAHDLNAQLKTAVPEIAPDLAEQGNLLGFQEGLASALPRLANNNMLPLESAIYVAGSPTLRGTLLALSRLKQTGDIGGRALYRGGTNLLTGGAQDTVANLMRAALVARLANGQ